MGLFSRKSSKTSEKKEDNRLQEALDYFSNEMVRCESTADEKIIKRLYRELTEQLDEETSDEDDLVDAITLVDRHTYYLCKALIRQNFMLMRKVDRLSDKIDHLEHIILNNR